MKSDTSIKSQLGQRIKDRRKKLGMTQSQLCGDYMTRNMLSRIETGDANPSLDTLMFISRKLKMPPSYFLCRDAKEEAEYSKIVKIKDARRTLATGQYKKCLDICEELPSDDDEISFIIAYSHTMAGLELFDKGELREALFHLDSAATALHSTVYMGGEILSHIKLLKGLIVCLSKGELPDTTILPSDIPAFFSKDRYMYISALALSQNGGDAFIADLIRENTLYHKHLTARALIKSNALEEATAILADVYERTEDCFCKYFTLCDLEECARLREDYKAAYTYSTEKASLHEKYNVI